jgi:Leucine-rich repeat (LRR) protein
MCVCLTGNEVAIALAPAIERMPYLQVLNLADNKLEDSGLSAIIRSITKHKDLKVLDISQNKIDDAASSALAQFVGAPGCMLDVLRVSIADIDDGECANFVDVLMHNRNLKVTDRSPPPHFGSPLMSIFTDVAGTGHVRQFNRQERES